MTQYSIERQQTLQAIQKRHEELLRQNDGSSEFAEKEVRPFLEEIAQAGKSIENPQERSWLRDFIGYWSGIFNEQEELPIVQLQPFDLSQVPRRSNLNFFRNPIWLVAILALIIIILVTGFISFRSFILHPSPTPTPRPTQPSAFHCPTSQQASIWMHVVVSKVTDHESCAFTAGNNGKQLSGVVCTSQDGGTTIEFIPVNQRNTVVVRACDGSQLPNIWGFTIRFISGYPSGDASVCAIARSAPNNVPAGWKVQADC